MTLAESAAALGVSVSTAKRRWSYVRARLSRDLNKSQTKT
jgi:DNA-directed RNA polymerase specialized sigma24 family protein